MTSIGKPCRQCGMRKSHKMDCSEPRVGGKVGPVEGLLPNVTAAAIAASKRQIVEGFNRLEANGVQPCAASIPLSDGSEINRYGDAKWEVVE